MFRAHLFVAVTAAALTVASSASAACTARTKFAVTVHGGSLDERVEDPARIPAMRDALEHARRELQEGGSALDVAERTVRRLEDSGAFNAGRGSNANAAGFIEVDASIMDGRDRRAGAVASMTGIKNAVSAARLLLEKSRPVMVVGDRGQAYVQSLGAETVPPEYFLKTRKPVPGERTHGTVGAAVLDRCGALAAATSTGGFGAKVPGRVGDVPVIGAGVWADDRVALSSTGLGEYFLRFAVAKDVADRMRYGKQSLRAAADAVVVKELGAAKAEAGLIGVNTRGEVLMTYNLVGMSRGYATDTQAPIALMYEGSRGDAR